MSLTLESRASRLLLALLAAVAVVAVASPARAGLKVVATLPDLAAVASVVGGPGVSVEALAGAEDPHYVDPKPSFIVKLSQADLLLANGLELEGGWLPPLQTQARNPKVGPGGAGYLEVATCGFALREFNRSADRSQGDIHVGGNPHFNLDPRVMARIALCVAERMASLDPQGAEGYRARAAEHAAALERFSFSVRERFKAIPKERRAVVSYHQSLVYLIDWLLLYEVATLEPKPGVPPNPRHVAGVMQSMKQRQVRAIIQESYYPRKTAETLAGLTGAQVVVLDGCTGFARGESYIEHMTHIAEQIHEALSRP